MTMFAVEVRYSSGQKERKIIAKFNTLAAAEKYALRHQEEGGGKLQVVSTKDGEHLDYIVDNSVSFAYHIEATAYAAYEQRDGCGGIP